MANLGLVASEGAYTTGVNLRKGGRVENFANALIYGNGDGVCIAGAFGRVIAHLSCSPTLGAGDLFFAA